MGRGSSKMWSWPLGLKLVETYANSMFFSAADELFWAGVCPREAISGQFFAVFFRSGVAMNLPKLKMEVDNAEIKVKIEPDDIKQEDDVDVDENGEDFPIVDLTDQIISICL